MAIEDVDYSVVLELADDTGQSFVNSFYIKGAPGFPGSASDLLNAFLDKWMDPIMAVLHSSMVSKTLTIRNLDDPGNFGDFPITGWSGQRGGEMMPAWDVFSFKLHRPTTLVRNGRKAFGRIAEGDVNNGDASSDGIDPITPGLFALANVLEAPLDRDAAPETVYRIAIPQSVWVVPALGKPHYEVQTLWRCTNVSYTRVSTQNSRKNF